MSSTSSVFDPTSPFVTFATLTTRGTLVALLRMIGINSRVRINEAIRIYFNNRQFLKKIIEFKLLINKYLHTCYDEYLSIHQQILDKKLQKSDVHEENMTHYVYYHIDKIILQTNGYKHLNCILDNLMTFCTYQFSQLFVLMLKENILFGSSAYDPSGDFNSAELNLLRHILDMKLKQVNELAQTTYLNNDKYKNIRLKCEENNSCELNIENIKQRLKEQKQMILLERETCECCCGEDEH